MSAADREAGLEALHTAAPAGGLRIATYTSYPPNRERGELRAVSARDVIVRTGRLVGAARAFTSMPRVAETVACVRTSRERWRGVAMAFTHPRQERNDSVQGVPVSG